MLKHIPLNYYALSGLVNFLSSFILAILVFYKNPRIKINRIFSQFALVSSGWGLFYFLWLSTTRNSTLAEFYLRTTMLFCIFVPSSFTHLVLVLLKVENYRKINIGNYLISFLIGITAFTQL